MIEPMISLFIFIGVYAVSKLLFSKIKPIAEIADVLAIVLGVLVALFYIGAF